MDALLIGIPALLLIATASVVLGALGRIVLGALFPAPAPDDDPRWVGTTPAERRAPRTAAQAAERGGALMIRTLMPDAVVPMARLADVEQPRTAREPAEPEAPRPTVAAASGPLSPRAGRSAARAAAGASSPGAAGAGQAPR
ncbi:hypothetical protein C1N80_03195 [Brachybacterium sp. SGAir0954]|uniref:hypothetical protein n=1 Tax=Brachybacterium sp. SGAir0954 TaxID=2571029 RepID=UPI0010CCC1CF|nr:hypothetical protein [Brachybacterium sp. SGAir0954]QCR52681.1 hypothetical protein C1N80_03195 [Brachybacterium sp. SGAir0954]